MEQISEILRQLFTYVFYPAVVIGLFLYIIGVIVFLIREAKDLDKVRRVTAAVLPVLLLIFIALATDKSSEPLKQFILSLSPFVLLGIGAATGIALVELARFLVPSDLEIGPSIYALFTSSIGVFMLYSIMQDIMGSLHLFLFGMLIIGGLDIVFLGPPEFTSSERRLGGPAISYGRGEDEKFPWGRPAPSPQESSDEYSARTKPAPKPILPKATKTESAEDLPKTSSRPERPASPGNNEPRW